MAQPIGGKVEKYMRKKIVHDEYPWPEAGIKGFKKIADFLPKPEELVFRIKKEEVTLPVSEHSLAFYRKYAKKHNIAFEDMLGAILDAYAQHSAAK